jgi:hypothetical protein
MWLTEFGWPGNGHAGDDYHPDEAAQARAVGQAYRLVRDDRRLAFVQSAFWFNLRDYAPRLANPDPEFFAHYGLLQRLQPEAGRPRVPPACPRRPLSGKVQADRRLARRHEDDEAVAVRGSSLRECLEAARALGLD